MLNQHSCFPLDIRQGYAKLKSLPLPKVSDTPLLSSEIEGLSFKLTLPSISQMWIF